MRRSTLALSSSLAAIGLTASIALAQQLSQAPAPGSAPPPASDDSIDPSMAGRPTRYLLRNGLDYLAYREYSRALSFFRAVEARQGRVHRARVRSRLNEVNSRQLKNGIAKAQQGPARRGQRPSRPSPRPKGRAVVQPGAFALAKPASKDPIQLASAEMPAPPPIPASSLPSLPPSTPAPEALTEPVQAPVPNPYTASPARAVFAVRDDQVAEVESVQRVLDEFIVSPILALSGERVAPSRQTFDLAPRRDADGSSRTSSQRVDLRKAGLRRAAISPTRHSRFQLKLAMRTGFASASQKTLPPSLTNQSYDIS